MSIEQIIEIQLDMEKDLKADIYGDVYGHERWAEEIFNLRRRLAEANLLIDETLEYLQTGGYLGQEAGLIYGCMKYLGKTNG